MTLQTQDIEIPLQGGLAELVDSHLVPMGAWLTLKNCRKNKVAGFNQRFGTDLLPLKTFVPGATYSNSSLTSCKAFGQYDDRPLLVADEHLYAYDETQAVWVDRTTRSDTNYRANIYSTILESFTIYGLNNRIVSFDWCMSADGSIHAAVELLDNTSPTPVNQIYDIVFNQQGQIVAGPTLIEPGKAPKIFYVNSKVILVYATGAASPGTIVARSKSSSLVNYSVSTNLTTNLYTTATWYGWDVRPYGNNLLLVYEDATHANPINLALFNSSFAAQYSVRSNYAASNFNSIIVSGDFANLQVWIGFVPNSGNGFVSLFTDGGASFTELATPAGAGNLSITAGTNGKLMRLILQPLSLTTCYFAGSFAEAFPTHPITRSCLVTYAGGYNSSNTRTWGCYQIASRIFLASDGRYYCYARGVTYYNTTPNALASTLHLIDIQAVTTGAESAVYRGRVVARGLSREVSNLTTDFINSRTVTTPIVNGNDVYIAAPLVRQIGVTEYPINVLKATWGRADTNRIIEYGKSAIIQPLQSFDGGKVAEIGFHEIPMVPIVAIAGGASSLSAGSYSYCFVLRHTNNAGEVVRSCPSPAATITVAAAQAVNITCRLHSLTDHQMPDITAAKAEIENVVVEIYRTLVNGQTYYLLWETPFITDPSVAMDSPWAFTTDTTISDTVLAGKPLLYTSQQAPNLSPPNLRSICSWYNRLCGIGPDNQTIWISNEIVAGYQPYFHETFNCDVNDQLTALGVVDDKLIAFTAESAYYISGNPADGLGQGNTLLPLSISADIGCTNERSVVTAGNGLLFQSRRSIGLVSRNLEVSEIGQPIQDTLAANPVITSVAYIDRDREARFTAQPTESSTDGVVIIFDTGTSTWSTDTFYDPQRNNTTTAFAGSSVMNGIWYGACSNGSILKENTSSYLDSGRFVGLEFSSPWIHVGALATHQRVRRIDLQAERITPHDIQIEIAKDYKDTVVQTRSWTNAQIEAFTTLPIEPLQVHVAQQKGKAIKITVRTIAPTSNVVGTGQGAKFYGLTIRAGAKMGIGKTLAEGHRK